MALQSGNGGRVMRRGADVDWEPFHDLELGCSAMVRYFMCSKLVSRCFLSSMYAHIAAFISFNL